MIGSVGAAFRKLEVSGDAKISSEELRNALKHRFNIEMTDETTRRVLREFDDNGDGEIEYREFVGRLLGGKDIDTEGRQGATGGGGRNGDGGRRGGAARGRAARRQGSGILDVRRRHEAALSMGRLRHRLQARYRHVRDAFRAIDVDSTTR